MSTEYEVFSKEGLELTVYEHSSLVDLCINKPLDKDFVEVTLYDLTPIQLAAIGIELLRVADYQDDNISGYLEHQFPSYETQAWARKQLGRE